ncbi:MAG: S-adenosylmethionine:tRNA ribosyltransferase-isomerase [Cyclobacteriaceae bacterium]
MSTESLVLNEFQYELPDEKIAKHPLSDRAASKLLYFNQGEINHRKFDEIPNIIPQETLLVFNDTKVIPARLILEKETGAKIEIFLLAPLKPSQVHEEIMGSKGSCVWQVMIGNSKRWKVGQDLHINLATTSLTARRTSTNEVTFDWSGDMTFSEILSEVGKIPLPPYLGRAATEEDVPRYQTVYSKSEGAVAAPTAGLHFTDKVLEEIRQKGIGMDFLTLHVSAGTFQPIKVDNVKEHPMHREHVVVSRANIENLLAAKNILPVGTTSMRTLESLFWFGQLLAENSEAEFAIKKETAYEAINVVSKEESLQAILAYLDRKGINQLLGHTEIFIYPGYEFRICDGLITNFHQPGSTLMLLVAALIGEQWKDVYQSALDNNYRFLSYGDSSLLLPKPLD